MRYQAVIHNCNYVLLLDLERYQKSLKWTTLAVWARKQTSKSAPTLLPLIVTKMRVLEQFAKVVLPYF